MKRFIIKLGKEGNASTKSEGIYLSHISDLHTWQPEKFEYPITIANLMKNNKLKDLKQIQGFLNVKYNRGPNLYQVQVLQETLQKISTSIVTQQNHHLLVSGDITNISHLEEFKLAKEILVDKFKQLIELENEEDLFKYCTLVPGKLSNIYNLKA
ncbi:predicted protein [Naegleria gruberi]|uniref:Predicted protein n=1 Tax=Naegleria gruberi TaxID=5762 RepID=D2VX43_NAEGR|nr:uncharacterized protein NAEGRDRAFT_73612 [Naegleria gruberi]EFC38559.1 predicted protein [Naegleria gruberi]|eukprot:XP_002671303.1 predicted protein [Naegleria gruberi strain NEG-M]